MATGSELKAKFWDELDDSPFVMLGLVGARESHAQPMTAQFDDSLPNKIYFYTNRQNSLIKALTQTHAAVLNYAAKGHDLFACIHGELSVDNDPAIVERFWSPIVSAWYDEGQTDPDLAMLRFDAGAAEIWKAGTGSFLRYMAAGLFGGNADDEAQENVVKTYF